ncbi:MAG: glycosyltransferase [Saprospiraceae bacterium]|nr:glycosyltransferase [Saprospiraceae bacterium]
MLRIGTSLAQSGFEVWLVGRQLPESKFFDNQYIKAHRFSLWFNKGKLFYVEYNIRLFFWLLTQRFDIIGGIDLDSILPCYFSAKIKNIGRGIKIKIIYDAHELFSETPEVVRRSLIRRVWLTIERFIVPKVDVAYTVSQSVADEFERRYGRRFGLIRNLPMRDVVTYPTHAAIEYLGIKMPAYKIGAKVILYQGALNEGRGLETAIEAMQYMENAEFWLIGEGDLSQILRGMVERLELQEKVKFLGFVVPDALPFFTAKASIGLHILEDKGLSYRYSLANKFLDYIQSGVPQICTQLPEYQRFNDQYNVGILIEKTDVQLLVSALNRLLNDPLFYQQIGENCRKAAVELCWEKEAEQLIALYQNMMNI